MKKRRDNVLILGDTHLPFVHKDYLHFCATMRDRCKCTKIIHIGDLVDNHAISYHEHDPDGMSAGYEYEETKKMLIPWFKEFPKLLLCRGNHDRLVDRKGKTAGLPSAMFRPFRKIWNLPDGWIDDWEFRIDNVMYEHGTGYSGKYPHMMAAVNNRCSSVIGHVHAASGIEWLANSRQCIFGMSVGCGVNRKTYAFAYGKDFKRKPLLSVGVVTDSGRYAQVMPMELK